MDFFRLGVELEGADVEIDLVIRIRRRAVDPTSEPGVLKTLRQPRAEKRRQRLRPVRASERGERLQFADQDVIAVEIGRRGRLADPELRADGVGRRRRRSSEVILESEEARSRMPKARARGCSQRQISIDLAIHPPFAPSLPAVILGQRGS